MLKSGIECLDERLGGLMPGRAHLLTGSPGSGKTVACLEFLHRGIEEGQPCALLTVEDPADLLSQCEYLGLSIDEAIASGQLALFRFQLDFVRRCSRLSTPELVFEELRRLLGDPPPARFVIDSIVPFLEGGTASGSVISVLVQYLEELGSTTLLTLPGNLESGFDRRIEPLVRRAVGIFHFSNERDRTTRIDVQKVRYPVPSSAPMRCRIEPGRGIVAAGGASASIGGGNGDERQRRLVVLDLTRDFPSELLTLLRRRFDVHVHSNLLGAYADLASAGVTILIGAQRDSLGDALTLVRQLRRSGNGAPIVLLTASALRSSDGARALRCGVDDFVPAVLPPDEVLLRVEAAARRGHVAPSTNGNGGLPAPPSATAGDVGMLGSDAFRLAIRRELERDALPFFTLVTVRPHEADDFEPLAELVRDCMRVDGGDFAGRLDDRIALYLHSARRKDVPPFVERLRSTWTGIGGGALEIETASWPADDVLIEELISEGERAR